MGVLIGEREGGNGISVGMIGVVFVFCGERNQLCWSLFILDWRFFYCFFPLMLRYGGLFAVGFFGCFFSPSLVGESSLSLLLFKFMDISIGSMF